MNSSKTKNISDKLSNLKGKALRKVLKSGSGSKVLNFLQKIGKSLVYPIAILPIAGLLNRLGVFFQDSTVFGSVSEQGGGLWWFGVIMQKPGDAAFANLPALFAIGTAFGFAKDNRGEAALVGFFAFMGFHLLVAGGWSIRSPEIYINSTTPMSGDVVVNWNLSWLIYKDVVVETTLSDGSFVVNGMFETMNLNGVNPGAFGGIVVGVMTATLYNKYSDIQLPAALSFFSGRRFVPMVAVFSIIPVAFIFAITWPWIQAALIEAGGWMSNNSEAGAGMYAFLNRLLVPFGLHNATINPILWFQLPTEFIVSGLQGTEATDLLATLDPDIWTYKIIDSQDVFIINGDINAFMGANNFINNLNTINPNATLQTEAGMFQTGFFPIMMFGVPAMGLAAIAAADKDDRKSSIGLFGGAAAVSFLTGITEPVEFAFAFIAPVLYFGHAILSGIVAALTTLMGVQLGFGFSAGFIDYAISIPTAISLGSGLGVGLIWIIGPIVGIIYFIVFFYGIQFFNVPTQGRTPWTGEKRIIRQPLAQWNYVPTEDERKAANTVVTKVYTSKSVKGKSKYSDKAKKLSSILEGNVTKIDNCATRLRLTVKDSKNIDKAKLKTEGFSQVVLLTKTSVQIIIGPDVELLAEELKKVMKIK